MGVLVDAVKFKGRIGKTIDVTVVTTLGLIIGTSACEDFKSRELKIQTFFEASRRRERTLAFNLCDYPHHATS